MGYDKSPKSVIFSPESFAARIDCKKGKKKLTDIGF
jgi:hypothetical protein